MVYAKGGEGGRRIFADCQHCVSPAVSSSAVAAAPGVLGKVLFIRRLRWADRLLLAQAGGRRLRTSQEKFRPEGKMDRRISHPP